MAEESHIHQSIIEDCRKGNARAKYELYKLYSKAMFNICYRMTGNREDAEDVLQDAFTQAFMKLETFRFESEFGSWLKRIVVNTCINSLNKRKVKLTYFDEMKKFEKPEDEPADHEYDTQSIIRAMEQLPQGGRMIFSLYLLEGYDHQEIAQILKISESTSKTQFMRAKNKVIEIIKGQKNYSNEKE